MSWEAEELAAELQRLTGCSGAHPVFAISETEPCDCCRRIRATARVEHHPDSLRVCQACLYEALRPGVRHMPVTVLILAVALLVLLGLTAWTVAEVFTR